MVPSSPVQYVRIVRVLSLICGGVAAMAPAGVTATAETLAAATMASAVLPSPQIGSPRAAASAPFDPPSGLSHGDNVRVVVRSYETAAIGAELNARIIRMPMREGDRFRKGDVLVAFDCGRIAAEHDAALAAAKAFENAYENQKQLLQYRAAGSFAVEQTRLEMEKARAEVRGIEAKRSSCTILAPFDGRVAEKVAQVHEIAQPNQPLIRIVNESKLELVLMAPSSWLPRIGAGMRFAVHIDESGEVHEARIIQSTGVIDPVSQSARFIAELIAPAATVLPGMSGNAMLSGSGASK